MPKKCTRAEHDHDAKPAMWVTCEFCSKRRMGVICDMHGPLCHACSFLYTDDRPSERTEMSYGHHNNYNSYSSKTYMVARKIAGDAHGAPLWSATESTVDAWVSRINALVAEREVASRGVQRMIDKLIRDLDPGWDLRGGTYVKLVVSSKSDPTISFCREIQFPAPVVLPSEIKP